jgi:hypothetical protein
VTQCTEDELIGKLPRSLYEQLLLFLNHGESTKSPYGLYPHLKVSGHDLLTSQKENLAPLFRSSSLFGSRSQTDVVSCSRHGDEDGKRAWHRYRTQRQQCSIN